MAGTLHDNNHQIKLTVTQILTIIKKKYIRYVKKIKKMWLVGYRKTWIGINVDFKKIKVSTSLYLDGGDILDS